MANLEPWIKNPQPLDEMTRDSFFIEFRENLISVIRDYIGLGVENELQLIAQAQKLFTGEVVPSVSDWESISFLMNELAKVKELSTMSRNFKNDLDPTLGMNAIIQMKNFLDNIQTIPPRAPEIEVATPEPSKPYLNKPVMSSTDSYMKSIDINWSINAGSLALKNANIVGVPSPSEDIKQYDLLVQAGSKEWVQTFGPKEAIKKTITLDWNSWFAAKDLHKASMTATLTAEDKRGNTNVVSSKASFKNDVYMPTPVKSYILEYQIDGGSWIRISEGKTSTSFKWTTIPKKTGNYRFRVVGIDQNGIGIGDVDGWTYAYSDTKHISYLPDPPEKPNPKWTSTWNTATITWKQCARAEYYEVWNGDEAWAKANTKGSNVYWKKVLATQKLSVDIHSLRSDANHGITVRAVNKGGNALGWVTVRTKKRTLKKANFSSNGTAVWRTAYSFKNANGWVSPPVLANWRNSGESGLYQGEWKEEGGWPAFRRRGGNGAYYDAYNYQNWGNHMSFIYFDNQKLRNTLRGKNIQKVSITLQRTTTGAHGFPVSTPLYLYNHKRYNNRSASLSYDFQAFRPDNGALLTVNNQKSTANIQFNRGETEVIANQWTKQLIQKIVDGSMNGLSLVKYYGPNLGSPTKISDRAYMQISKKVKLDIEYYDD